MKNNCAKESKNDTWVIKVEFFRYIKEEPQSKKHTHHMNTKREKCSNKQKIAYLNKGRILTISNERIKDILTKSKTKCDNNTPKNYSNKTISANSSCKDYLI